MMRSFGIDQANLSVLYELLETHLGSVKDVRVWLFGSRAKGSHKKNSDIDLAVNSRSKDLSSKVMLLQSELRESNLPFSVDVVLWRDLAEEFLPEVKKTRVPFWDPSLIERRSLWRICPIGQHWVRRHDRRKDISAIEDVDGHCRRNPSGKDWLKTEEMVRISQMDIFKTVPQLLKFEDPDWNAYDGLIAGWTAYWNSMIPSERALDPNIVKLLIASESSFRPFVQNVSRQGAVRGLGQITESTWKIMKNPKGELKDHFIDVSWDDLNDPSINIATLIRWMIRKRTVARSRLKREPTDREVLLCYKGVLGQSLRYTLVRKTHKNLETNARELRFKL